MKVHELLDTNPLSYDDACRLSRVFNEGANLRRQQDYEINEWLKRLIEALYNAEM